MRAGRGVRDRILPTTPRVTNYGSQSIHGRSLIEIGAGAKLVDWRAPKIAGLAEEANVVDQRI